MKALILIFAIISLTPNNMSGQDFNRKIGMSIPYGRFAPMHKAEISGVEFTLGVDEKRNCLYISTHNSNFKIKDENIIGRPLSSFKNKADVKLNQGWGHYLKIDENWYAGFSNKINNNSKALFVFQYKFTKNNKPPISIDLKLEERKKTLNSKPKTPELSPYNRIIPGYKTKINGIDFYIEVDDRRGSLYIATHSPQFEINNKTVIDQPLSSFKNKNDHHIVRGWGNILKVDENWYAVFDWRKLRDGSKVLLVFQNKFN